MPTGALTSARSQRPFSATLFTAPPNRSAPPRVLTDALTSGAWRLMTPLNLNLSLMPVPPGCGGSMSVTSLLLKRGGKRLTMWCGTSLRWWGRGPSRPSSRSSSCRRLPPGWGSRMGQERRGGGTQGNHRATWAPDGAFNFRPPLKSSVRGLTALAQSRRKEIPGCLPLSSSQ